MSIIKNLETLLEAVKAQPEKQFDLSVFRQDTPCGTNFCTLGLACSMPWFQEQGYSFVPSPFGDGYFISSYQGQDVRDNLRMVDGTFGEVAFGYLFKPAGDGDSDEALGYESSYVYDDATGVGDLKANMTDKALAIARLELRIAQLKEEQE